MRVKLFEGMDLKGLEVVSEKRIGGANVTSEFDKLPPDIELEFSPYRFLGNSIKDSYGGNYGKITIPTEVSCYRTLLKCGLSLLTLKDRDGNTFAPTTPQNHIFRNGYHNIEKCQLGILNLEKLSFMRTFSGGTPSVDTITQYSGARNNLQVIANCSVNGDVHLLLVCAGKRGKTNWKMHIPFQGHPGIYYWEENPKYEVSAGFIQKSNRYSPKHSLETNIVVRKRGSEVESFGPDSLKKIRSLANLSHRIPNEISHERLTQIVDEVLKDIHEGRKVRDIFALTEATSG